MKKINIQKQIRLHNSTNMFKGIAVGLISAVCWYISYWLVHTLAFFPLSNFRVGSARTISHVIAIIAMGLLIFEGIRFGKPRMQIEEIGKWHATGTYGGYETAKVLGFMYMISNILFFAPRSMIYSVKSFWSIIRADERMIAQANAALEKIVENNHWLARDRIDEDILSMLYSLKLLHFRNHAGTEEAGLSPKTRKLFDIGFPDPLNAGTEN